MKRTEDVTALVVDCGLFVEQAVTLARTYKRVLYHAPWVSAFPKANTAFIGRGLENIEVVPDVFGKHFDETNLFVFPDIYFGALQLHLADLGKTVWGGRMGEELELRRDFTKEVMKNLGLPVGRYAVVKSIANLREYLKDNPDQFVKINTYRGSFETFYSKDYQTVEPKLDELEYRLGAFKHVLEFIVEQALRDRIETGIDTCCIDGRYPKTTMVGVEIKDSCYALTISDFDQIAEPLTRWNTVMAPMLRGYQYRGFLSTEVRIGEDKMPYMIDACMRSGSPPNELYQEMYANFADIVWQGAQGNLVEPEPIARYGAQVLLISPWAATGFQPIDFPERYRRHVKLRNGAKLNGRFYALPQGHDIPEIASVVGWGDTMSAAFDQVRDVCDNISGYQIHKAVDSFHSVTTELQKLETYGLVPF